MNTPTGNLYILIEPRFYIQNKDVVKIGRTDRTVFERLLDYPKDSKILGFGSIYDSKIGENKLIRKFTKKFTRYFAKSREYYYGNLDQMVAYFHKCVFKIYQSQTRSLHDVSFYENHKPLPLVHGDKYVLENSNKTNEDQHIGSDKNSGEDPNEDINETLADNILVVDNILDVDDLNSSNVGVSNNQENVTQTEDQTDPFIDHLINNPPEWFVPGETVKYDTLYDEHEEFGILSKKAFTLKYENVLYKKSKRNMEHGKLVQMIKLLDI